MKDTPTYAKALAELEDILAQLQADNCDIDRLTALTTRAAELLKYCRSRLVATQEELQGVLRSLQDSEAS